MTTTDNGFAATRRLILQGAATVALGPGMALLHLLITAIAVSMEIQAMAFAEFQSL